MDPHTATPNVRKARIVTKLSPWSLADTTARLSAIAAARGMKIFAVIDHSGEAEDVGLDLHRHQARVFWGPQFHGGQLATGGSWVRPFQDSLARKCSPMGVPANFSPSRREKSSSELRGR